jgi:hydroxymethylpyrimidine pyrophosphatase-like HAD family hydrolase
MANIINNNGSVVLSESTKNEINSRADFFELFKNTPIPKEQLLNSLGLFINRQSLSRILLMNELYKKILNTHGIICEFGVYWGQNLALFESFRGMYELYNYNRKIVGFDTFEGFSTIDEKDKTSDIIQKGAYATTKGYEDILSQILDYHEANSPVSHIKKYELIKGDASVTIKEYLKQNPETIIAFAYFDFDVYKPTKDCLEAILPHLSKGAIIGFDELNYHPFPGETFAFNEVLGLNNYKLNRDVNNPLVSYIIYE